MMGLTESSGVSLCVTMFLAMQDALDDALKKFCRHFDGARFENVLAAYRMLGKSQKAIDQLQAHFLANIETCVGFC
jgi:hypothetical protein